MQVTPGVATGRPSISARRPGTVMLAERPLRKSLWRKPRMG